MVQPILALAPESRLRWFGQHVESEDTDWNGLNVEQRGKWKELNQGVSETDMVMGWYQRGYEKICLSREDAQSRRNEEGKLRVNPANPGSPGRWPMCVGEMKG